ncbi:hypothetical protein BO99DRAFT_340612 [Aspergillus violaceofuscus CBS 115571]|uniref:Uncharacterized protein n=1 Tax=Aspergillus violaceofuscus (strain CBS 115571) TaxID=1450538 RepID=A0A2V5H5U9_ASPV1|nr:hypothetical protein BO99DRAFT_340612 [Aspergillus violaceofuscus CBS 115571]
MPILSKREKLIRRIETGGQRKSHFKSRNGCNFCKEKRVKSSQAPSLLHAILAVSARDLLYLQPDRHQLLPIFYHHYQQFAALYNQDLTQPPSVTAANLMHSNAFLMNVLVVADPSSKASTSWVTRTEQEDIDQAFSWIKVQAIHQSILHPYNTYLPHTFWYPEFTKNHDIMQTPQASGLQPGPQLTAQLVEICDIQPSDTTNTNVYLSAYRVLCTICETAAMNKHLAPQLFGVYIRFIVEMKPPFVQLLHRRDEVALLLFAIWLSEMQELDLWWMRDRARNECRSICGMLLRSEDWRIRGVAEYLAGLIRPGGLVRSNGL